MPRLACKPAACQLLLADILKALFDVIFGQVLHYVISVNTVKVRTCPESGSNTHFPRFINILRPHLQRLEIDRHIKFWQVPAARACVPRRVRLARPVIAATSFGRRHLTTACTGAHLYLAVITRSVRSSLDVSRVAFLVMCATHRKRGIIRDLALLH